MPNSIGTRDSQRINDGSNSNDSRGFSRNSHSEIMGSVVGTLAFTASNTITDSGNNFVNRGIGVGDVVRIAGSPLNSREYKVLTVAAGSITVAPSVVQSEGNNSVAWLRRVN